eukprot:gene20311-22310_t
MGWDNLDIDAGLGDGDETKRFGARNEKGSSLYQIDTLACISKRGDNIESGGCPNLMAIANPLGISLVIANNVITFNESDNTHLLSLSFGSQVNCIAWTEDGQFLAIAESSGKLNLAYVPAKKVIWNKVVLDSDIDKTQTFRSLMFHKVEKGVFELEVLPAHGSIMRLKNLNFEMFEKAISEGNITEMQQIQSEVTLDTINASNAHSHSLNSVSSFNDQRLANRLLISGQGQNGMSIWEKNDTDEFSVIDFVADYFDEDIGFLKCIPSPNDDFIIALDTDHHISIWSAALLTPIAFWDDVEVDDVMLYSTNMVEDGDGRKRGFTEDIKMVILTKSDSKKSLLQVYSLPNFEHVYTLQVSGCAKLASVKSQLDAIYFIEGVEDELSNDSFYEDDGNEMDISTIRLRRLTEALPESRFSRLLLKEKFDLAENFAKLFNLDIELVYCVKANSISERMSPWGRSPPSTDEEYEDAIKELKDCLDNISDLTQIISTCLHAELPTIHWTFDLLKYAKERVDSKEGGWSSTPNVQSLIDGLNRLVTFQVAFGAKNFSVTTWKPFLSASLLDEIINCFKNDVNAAIVIWRRHQSELEPGFTLEKLETLLRSIPESVPSSKIIQWLRQDFVPFVLTKLPDGQMMLAKWLEARASNMEVTEKDSWPTNALELAEVMFNVFSDVAKTAYGRGHATPAQFAMQICKLSIPCSSQDETDQMDDENSLPSTMSKLADLVTCLREISALHSQYACKLSLHCYKKENTKTISFRLLDRVLAPELIVNTIEKYVKPYAIKHNLPLYSLLLDYVEDLMERQPGLASSLWLSKVIAIINCITEKEAKCKATLIVMSNANRPWSSDVQRLVDSMMKEHPDNEDLKQQYQYAELRTTMIKYGVRNYNINDPIKGLDTIHYIFTCDTESAMSDAKQVIKTFLLEERYVYFFRIQTWIIKEKIEECCDLLRSIDTKVAIDSGNDIINWVISSLDDEPMDDLDKNERMTSLRAATEIIRTLSSLDSTFEIEHREEYSSFKSIFDLQVKFDIYLSMDEVSNESKRNEIWRNYSNQEGNTQNQSDNNTINEKSKLCQIRLSHLLGFDDISQKEQDISLYLDQGMIRQVLRILRDSKTGVPNGALLQLFKRTLHHLLTENWHESGERENSQFLSYIEHTYRVSCFATSISDPDELRTFLEISRLLRLATAIAEQCESADYEQDAFRQTKLFAKWNLDDRYEDDGMVLNSHEVIPLLKRYYKACFNDIGDYAKFESCHLSAGFGKSTALQDLAVTNQAIVKLLKENNLEVLALEFIYQAISTSILHVTNMDMGFPIPSVYISEVQANKISLDRILPVAVKMAVATSNELLTKILIHYHIDCDLALGHLCTMPVESGMEKMAELKEKLGTKHRIMETAALIGVVYAGLTNNKSLLKVCQQLQDSAYWGRKFIQLKISFKDVYRLNSVGVEEKQTLLKKLVSNPNIDIDTLQKFRKTFNYDEDESLLLYITTMLLPSRSSRQAKFNKERILEAMSHVQSSENLFKTLRSCFKMISPYDYEKLSLVLGKMNEIVPNTVDTMILLLDCLLTYQRCCQPLEYELSYFTHTEDEQLLHGSANVLPEAAKTRLPFHPLIEGQPWKILSPELISEDVVRKIETIARCIKLDSDQLYTTAVHNIVNNQLKLDKRDQNDNKSNATTFKFETIKGLLHSVANPEMAIAAAKWVAKLLPTGHEKVRALKSCVELCKNMEKSCGESDLQKVNDWSRRLENLCKRIEAEAVLSNFGINDDSYLNLTQQPATLICKLYEDFGCKAEIVNGRVVGIPNIHALAEEISSISSISLKKIHVYLLEKWLPSCHKSRSQDGDTTLLDVSMVCEDDDSKVDERSDSNCLPFRVIYILNNAELGNNAEFLLHFAFKEVSSTVTHVCRIRALQALFTLVSVMKIQETAARPLDEIRHYLTCLIYLAELEELHLPQTMSAFLKCKKDGLVKGLWRNHSQEPKGIRLIADLCLDYNIYDPQLWNILLPQFLSFGMTEYLRHTLLVLSGIPELREIPCLAKMWRGMILAPFSSVSVPLSEEEELQCLESANLLQRCPVILHLDLKDIANRYYKIGMFSQALSCLSLIPDGTIRNQCLQRVLKDVGCFAVLDQIEGERKKGRLDGHLDHVEEEVFDHVNKQKLFKEMFQTTHFQKFISYLINSDQLSDLLMETLENGRIKNAIQLVERYEKSSSTIRKTSHNLKGLSLLMAYLQEKNILEKAIVYLPDAKEYNQDSL